MRSMLPCLLAPLLACAGATDTASESPAANESHQAAAAGPAEMTPEQMAELEKKMWELAQPGPEHQILEGMVGEWDMVTVFDMGQGKQEMHATIKAEMVLGGRFLLQRMDAPPDAKEPMEGIWIMGFDRRHEQFTVYGCDSMGTYCVAGTGPWDAAKKTMTLHGEDVDPVAGVTQVYDFIITVKDADHFESKVVFAPGTFGNEEPLVAAENKYTRIK